MAARVHYQRKTERSGSTQLAAIAIAMYMGYAFVKFLSFHALAFFAGSVNKAFATSSLAFVVYHSNLTLPLRRLTFLSYLLYLTLSAISQCQLIMTFSGYMQHGYCLRQVISSHRGLLEVRLTRNHGPEYQFLFTRIGDPPIEVFGLSRPWPTKWFGMPWSRQYIAYVLY